jgi:PII-like signaling protein
VSGESLKLTVYFGEGDDLADPLIAIFGRHRAAASALLRGAEGFGIKHHLRSERLLTLSEDLPLVAVAVDSRERIETMLPDVTALVGDGLVTLERVQPAEEPDLGHDAKLTVYCGRKETVRGGPAFVAIVDLLHRHGLSGATVMLGVDATVRGERHRARFFSRNADVLLVIESVGERERALTAVEELGRTLDEPLLALERIRICRRDGQALADPHDGPGWQRLTVHSSGGTPVHAELVRRLRQAGTGGATCVRGIWGYHGDHRPHGDTLRSLRRRAPVLTTIVAEPGSVERCFEIVTELTAHSGLVTSEPLQVAWISGGKPGPGIE